MNRADATIASLRRRMPMVLRPRREGATGDYHRHMLLQIFIMRTRKYQHDHTKRWSERVARADAFVFVTSEYNYSAPPSIVNALDYFVHEWAYKPPAFVSYGGVSGGTRSVQMIKVQATALRMMPIPEAVSLPFFAKMFGADGSFSPGEIQEKAAGAMLTELKRWADVLRSLR